ncbi:MAG: TonB-dependent receptor [Burkholderiales bacterium]|nr:TonB-dependent receptor [Burkholderiales bacterium]
MTVRGSPAPRVVQGTWVVGRRSQKGLGGLAGLVVLQVALGTCQAAAKPGDEEDLAQAFGDKSFVSIATGSRLAVRRAPAVATVITAADIRATGATDLDEVLQAVPGLTVAHLLPYDNKPIYIVRGIATQYNPQVLMLVNGVPITSVYLGNRGDVWGGMPVENIARIEVIRGPGSALYGADAFSGVINIVTKTASDLAGAEAGVRAGSFKTADAWLQYGGKAGGFEVAAYLGVGRTDGHRRVVEADAQTANDAIFGTRASLAPGPVSLGRKAVDGHLDIANGAWRFRAGYKHRDDVGSGSGVAGALDRDGRSATRRLTADLTYETRDLVEDWEFSAQASYFDMATRSHLVLLPPGTVLLGPFPEGMVGAPSKWERHARLTGAAVYTGWAGHRLRIGLGVAQEDVYRIGESKNFTLVFVPGIGNVPAPTGALVDVSLSTPYLDPRRRDLGFVYLQDEWSVARDWTLTAGLRHDRYSDFGATTNPRLALVWDMAYNVTAKLLYGAAFRAPSFVELYAINNPVTLGNPAVQPERIGTWEAALAWQPSGTLSLGANIFHYRMRDILRQVPNADPTTGSTARNAGRQVGSGLEVDVQWNPRRDLRLSASYGYQRSTDKTNRQDAGIAPHHHLYLRGDWRFASGWEADAQINWVADRRREAGDPRPPIADYTLVDLTLRKLGGSRQWDLSATVRNLFNTNAREPSFAPGALPFDFPLPGRALSVQASYRF